MSLPHDDTGYPSFEIAESLILNLIGYLEDSAHSADVDGTAFEALGRRRAANEWRKFLEKQRTKRDTETRCAS